jgi:peptidyl-Lys metalloendopeptidase
MLMISFSTTSETLESMVVATVQNTGARSVSLLYWKGPFDTIDQSAIRLVDDDGLEIAYRGRRAKRRFDPDVSLVLFEPGETRTVVIDLAEQFELPYKGAYSVSIDMTDVLGGQTETEFGPAHERVESDIESLRLVLEPKPSIEFEPPVEPSFDSKQDIKLTPAPICPPMFFCYPPAYHDGGICHLNRYIGFTRIRSRNSSKTKILHDQALVAYQKILLFKVRDTPAFRRWFGAYSAQKAEKAWKVIGGIRGQLRCKSHAFYTDLGNCKDDTLAWFWTSSDPKKMSAANYCSTFFSLPDTGVDTKWGTILHELSHGYGGTSDHAYGQVRCEGLARNAPHLALENADSYQYYLEEEA